jgi:hypothetical protein
MIAKGSDSSPKMNLLDNTFPMRYHFPQMKIICQSYAPGKLIHQTTQNKVHKTDGFSSSRVRVLDLFSVNLSAGEQKGDRSACLVGFTKAEHL